MWTDSEQKYNTKAVKFINNTHKKTNKLKYVKLKPQQKSRHRKLATLHIS